MKRHSRVRCPLCGHSKIIGSPEVEARGGTLWLPFNGNSQYISIREGGGKVGTGMKGRGQGRGYGFPTIASLKFADVLSYNMSEYGGTVNDMKAAIINIVKECKKLGLISEAELK